MNQLVKAINQSRRGNFPPPLSTNVKFRHTFRFQGSATAAVVTNRDLLMAAGSVCTANNSTLVSLGQAVKLVRVRAWGMSDDVNPCTISLKWTTGSGFTSFGDAFKEVSDTSISSAFPSYINTYPPRGSIQSFWQRRDATIDLFTFGVDNGNAIIDITLEVVLRDDAETGATRTVSSASLGNLYWFALTDSDEFQPIGLTTTT